jgi:vitamin B12 transporter
MKPGQVRRPARDYHNSKLSGRKASDHSLIPHLSFLLSDGCMKRDVLYCRLINFFDVQSHPGRNRNNQLRTILFCVVFLLEASLHGQDSTDNDTIKIKEVVISMNRIDSEPAGYKKMSIDSTVISNYSNRNLSDMLSDNSNIFIKSYGMGGTATPAFRGTGASHTLIDWNGININSPMLGQTDLSIIPAGFFDDVQIYFGGASMQLNNGGIGGTINLETKPVWKNETSISSYAGIGSFGTYSGLIKVRTGNIKFQTVTKAFFQRSENNFRYLNNEIGSEPVWQTRTNSQVHQMGFIQEFYFHHTNSNTSARIWYQSSDRNLPATLLTLQSNTKEKQDDESLRAMLNYDFSKGQSNFSVTSAWTLSRLNYFNHLASIDSRNQSEILTLKACFETQIKEYAKLKIVLDDQSGIVKSNNYNANKPRNTATLTASVNRARDRFETYLLLSEIFDRSNLLIPDFSAGIQYRIIDDKEYFLKANISRNSKIPTMNDLFWYPGGNPELKNEYAFVYEISYEMIRKISIPSNLKYDLSVFHNSIKDMIQWHPGESSYWTADNINKVNTAGFETSVSFDYILNDINASLRAGYSYTRATEGESRLENDVSVGKQLMYIPENLIDATTKFGYKNIYSSWIINFTGKRFITADNSKYLPAYLINNFNCGIKLPVRNSTIDLNFNIDNLFNSYYQSIAHYPLPGRSYYVKILIQIIK